MFSDDYKLDDENMQMVILKISHLYFRNIFRQLTDTNVHPGQLPMIKLLGESEGLSQHEIAEKLHIKPPTVNVSIKRMEKAGLVERKTDSCNARANRIFLTQDGIYFYEKMNALVKQNESALFRGFTESEICLMKRFFEQIVKNLEALPTEKGEE